MTGRRTTTETLEPARAPADPLSTGAVCTRILTVVRRDTPLVDAARRMRDDHVGCVVVAEPSAAGEVAVGMLTDRDIVVGVVALGIAPGPLTVADAMSDGVATVREDASLGAALATMREHGVRRLPVVADGGALVGLISFDDLVAALTLQTQLMTDTLVSGRMREGARRP